MKKACVIKSTDAYEAFELRADLEDIFESLGIIDSSYTSWERINETSACLLKTIEGKCHQGHP
jgi:hypothetical protein